MSTYERTPLAITMCLALVIAALALIMANFDWPTSRIVQGGFSITEQDILLYDVLPLIIAGYAVGLGAIAITRFIFPRSNTKAVLCVVFACAGLAALPVLMLSAAISGAPTIRDLGATMMLFAVPAAIATWTVISSCLARSSCRSG
jgi:hypothetical protein